MYSAAFSALTRFAVLPITTFSSHSQSICVRAWRQHDRVAVPGDRAVAPSGSSTGCAAGRPVSIPVPRNPECDLRINLVGAGRRTVASPRISSPCSL